MTSDPDFYKHTQRLFLMMHERGLAYQAESQVNFDPVDRTVLANEQVDANGFSWRSGAKVQKVQLKQWFLRVTAFKEALLQDLNLLSQEGQWPDRVLAMQQNWLGKSDGARIRFPLVQRDGSKEESIDVFTTRPDTLFGAQYLALSAHHPLVLQKARTDDKLQDFLDGAERLPPDSKDGYLLDLQVINPLATLPNSSENLRRPLPIFVAPYVLQGYGEGAVMGVPGHDLRDNQFWKSNGDGDT